VAITSTQVEPNIVNVNSSQIANPHYRIGILLEVIDYGQKKWYNYHLLILLVLDNSIYTLTEHLNNNISIKDIKDNTQQFYFSLMDDVAPQLESIIEETILDI
jgi:hypothetical protein